MSCEEGEESWEGSAKKVAEGSDASRKYVARVGLNWSLLSDLRRANQRRCGYSLRRDRQGM